MLAQIGRIGDQRRLVRPDGRIARVSQSQPTPIKKAALSGSFLSVPVKLAGSGTQKSLALSILLAT